MPNTVQEELRRYAALIDAAIPRPVPPFDATAEDASAVRVERGTVFPLCLRDAADPAAAARVARLVELSTLSPDRLSALRVVDRAGHDRPAHRPLLVYAWLQAYRLAYETLPRAEFGRWEEGLRPWCDLLEARLARLGETDLSTNATPAARGAAATEAAWSALALFVAGRAFVRDAWTDLAADAFGRLTRGQADDGPFLRAAAGDNPETLWFHELVLLHAAAAYAVQAEDRTVAAAVARNAGHHLRETQPDHATGQPWGLFAFAWDPEARPLADQLLHAVSVQAAQGRQDGVTTILLADALHCLRLFL